MIAVSVRRIDDRRLAKAATPFEIASTPVICTQPLAKGQHQHPQRPAASVASPRSAAATAGLSVRQHRLDDADSEHRQQ